MLRLSAFERSAYEASINVFMTGSCMLVTLNNDLYGTRTRYRGENT